MLPIASLVFFFLNVVTRGFLNIWLKICLSFSNNICTIKKCSSIYYKLNQTFCRSYPFITHLCPSLLLNQIMTTRTASKPLIKNKQKPISIVNNPKLCLFMGFFFLILAADYCFDGLYLRRFHGSWIRLWYLNFFLSCFINFIAQDNKQVK